MFGDVNMFVSWVFGGLTKCASNGVTLVVVFGISFIFSIMFAIFSAIVSFAQSFQC